MFPTYTTCFHSVGIHAVNLASNVVHPKQVQTQKLYHPKKVGDFCSIRSQNVQLCGDNSGLDLEFHLRIPQRRHSSEARISSLTGYSDILYFINCVGILNRALHHSSFRPKTVGRSLDLLADFWIGLDYFDRFIFHHRGFKPPTSLNLPTWYGRHKLVFKHFRGPSAVITFMQLSFERKKNVLMEVLIVL